MTNLWKQVRAVAFPIYSIPLDPQNFGFLDPEKYADPWIRIQVAKYQQN